MPIRVLVMLSGRMINGMVCLEWCFAVAIGYCKCTDLDHSYLLPCLDLVASF